MVQEAEALVIKPDDLSLIPEGPPGGKRPDL